jgi:hypothetical protein
VTGGWSSPSGPLEPLTDVTARILELLQKLVAEVPTSSELEVADPRARARALNARAAMKAAGISGVLSLPPGPLGLVTILPDLYAIWRIQSQLVADIAATFGKTGMLNRDTMLYCLFRHAAAQALRDVVTRVGERFVVRPTSLRLLQKILRAIGIQTTQRLLGRGLARLLPLIGALGVAGYAYYDTGRVGSTAIEFFSSQIDAVDGGEGTGA